MIVEPLYVKLDNGEIYIRKDESSNMWLRIDDKALIIEETDDNED